MAIAVTGSGTAIAFIADKAAATTTFTSSAFTTTAAIGDLILIGVACDNAGAAGIKSLTTVTDSKGNTYTALGPGIINRTAASAASDGCTVAIFGSTLTAALTTSDTFTVNWSPATTAKVATAIKVTGAGAVFNSNSATGTGTTWTSGGASSSLATGEMIISYRAHESATISANPTGTGGGTWDAGAGGNTGGSGGDATKMAGAFTWKIVSGAGTQTATGAASVSTDWAAIYLCYRVGTGAQTVGPATGVTVTTTAGTPSFAIDQTISAVTGPTVAVTTGTPALALAVGPAAAPTVTVTPGTGTVAEAGVQTITPTGPTVTVTPGTGILGQQVAASAFLGLADTPGDFDTMTGLTADLYVAEAGTRVDDSLDLYAQVFAADESTPLTDEELVYSHGGTPGLQSVTFSGVVASNKTTWDAARLRLRWSNLRVGTDDLLDVRVHAVTVSGTYATAGALTISPAGPTVTITTGVPSFALAISPAAPTVTVSTGTPSLALAVSPTGVTVSVTPGTGNVSLSGGLQSFTAAGPTVTVSTGTPALQLTVGPALGVTVTTTPGTALVGPPSPRPAGPTVTVSTGVPAFARTIGPATGVTVTVSTGTPQLALQVGPATGATVTVTPGTGAVSVAGGAQNVLPAGVTVTVTPGVPQLVYGQTVTASGVTVSVTAGTGTVIRAQAIGPAVGATVSVTPGVPTVKAGFRVTGPTVSVTPGTVTVGANQSIPLAGVTVTITPGGILLAGIQSVGPATPPTVVVTPGDPQVTRDPQQERNRFVAALDWSTDEWQPHLWPAAPVPLDPANATEGLVGAGAPHLDAHPETTLG